MSVARILLLIHVLAGIAWVGGGFVIFLTVVVARRSGGQEAADRALSSFGWADTWLAIVAPLLVVTSGVAMVIESSAWAFSQPWIASALALVVVYEVVAATFGGRLFRRIEALRERGAFADTAGEDVLRDYVRLGSVLLAILVAIVALMVFKPM
jgi:uncharacterized membrane protein